MKTVSQIAHETGIAPEVVAKGVWVSYNSIISAFLYSKTEETLAKVRKVFDLPCCKKYILEVENRVMEFKVKIPKKSFEENLENLRKLSANSSWLHAEFYKTLYSAETLEQRLQVYREGERIWSERFGEQFYERYPDDIVNLKEETELKISYIEPSCQNMDRFLKIAKPLWEYNEILRDICRHNIMRVVLSCSGRNRSKFLESLYQELREILGIGFEKDIIAEKIQKKIVDCIFINSLGDDPAADAIKLARKLA